MADFGPPATLGQVNVIFIGLLDVDSLPLARKQWV